MHGAEQRVVRPIGVDARAGRRGSVICLEEFVGRSRGMVVAGAWRPRVEDEDRAARLTWTPAARPALRWKMAVTYYMAREAAFLHAPVEKLGRDPTP